MAGIPSGGDPSNYDLGDFGMVGAGASRLQDHTQAAIENFYRDQLAGNSGWLPLLEQLWEGLDQALALPMAIIKKIVETLILNPLDNIIDAALALLGLPPVDVDTVEGLLTTLGSIGQWLFGGLASVLEFFKGPIDGVLNFGNAILKAIFGTGYDNAKTFVENLIKAIFGSITNGLDFVGHVLKSIFGNGFDGAKTFVENLIKAIFGSITSGLDFVGHILKSIFGSSFDSAKTFVENLIKVLLGSAEDTVAFFTALVNKLIYWITHPGGPNGIGYLLIESLKTLFASSGAILETVINSIVYWLTNPGPLVTGIVNMIRDGITNGGLILTAIFDAVTHWVTGGAQTLQQFFGGMWGNSTSLVKHVMDQVITAILGPYAIRDWTALTKWASGLLTLDNLIATIKKIFPWLSSLFPVLDTSDGSTVNLLNQGDFKTASTLNADSGWSWDSSSNTTDSGGGSAKVTGFGSAVKALYCNQYITVTTGDVLNMSAYVKTESFSATTGTKPITLDVIPYTGTSAGDVQKVADSGAATTFTKIAGTYTVPAGVTSVRVRIAVSTDATGGTVWFDDIFLGNKRTLQQPLVNELTGAFGGIKDALTRNGRGTTPTTTMDYSSFFDATTSTTGLIGTISSTASGAAGNVQSVVDNIAQTVGASPGAVNQPPTTVTANFQNFFNKLYGANTPQNTVPQGKITDLTGAFGGVKDALARNGRGTTPSTTLDYTSFFDTTTATTGLIGTAAAQADLGVGNAQKLSDGLVQTVGGGGSTTGVPANTRTYFENFLNKLYGTGVSTPQTYITNNTINGLPVTKLSGQIAQGQILNGAVSADKLASTVVSDIATSVKSTTVGTGAVMARINPAGAHTAITTGQTTFGTASNPFFNTLTRTTDDITTPTSSVTYAGTTYTFYTGEFVVTNPGWYMCEVGLRINVGNGIPGTGTNYGGPGAAQYTGNYNFTPILYLKPSGGTQTVHRYGTEVMGVMYTIAGQRQGRFANSSWIVYLSAGDSVQAGYSAGVIDANAGGNRIGFFGADNTGKDSYFAIALLNRS